MRLIEVDYHLQRGSAKQSVKDGLTSLWQYGNCNPSLYRKHSLQVIMMMKLCSFDNVGMTNKLAKFVSNPPAMVTYVWMNIQTYVKCSNIHFLWLFFFPAFLPFFLCTSTGQTDWDNFMHNWSRDAVWRKAVPPLSKSFSIFQRFGGNFAPETQNVVPSLVIAAKTKKPYHVKTVQGIDQKCQLNTSTKSG